MIRALQIVSTVAGVLIGFVFGIAAWRAVPRLECDWGVDFCSDYSGFYWAFAIVSVLGSLLVAKALSYWRKQNDH